MSFLSKPDVRANTIILEHDLAVGQPRVGQPVAWVFHERLLQIPNRLLSSFSCPLIPIEAGFQVTLVRLGVLGEMLAKSLLLLTGQPQSQVSEISREMSSCTIRMPERSRCGCFCNCLQGTSTSWILDILDIRDAIGALTRTASIGIAGYVRLIGTITARAPDNL